MDTRIDADADDVIQLSEPDIGVGEMTAVLEILRRPCLGAGPVTRAFERAFAARLGRTQGVAVASGMAGMILALRALGMAAGDEVIAPAYSWHQLAHAIVLVGATPVFADIDYWSGCVNPECVAAAITPRTAAIIGCNLDGHPADWTALRALAEQHGVALIEDSSEALASVYRGRPVGSFGDVSVFDFSQPGAITCGTGAIVVADDPDLAARLRYLRARRPEDRTSVSVGRWVPMQADLGDYAAALVRAQFDRIDAVLAAREQVVEWYHEEMQFFEGIKPPYVGDHVDAVHWMLYLVHLGKRFTASACREIVDDLVTAGIRGALFCQPLHQQFHYQQLGWRRGALPMTERIADRALALPLHTRLDRDQVSFIVKTLKDASANVGAGAAIYL